MLKSLLAAAAILAATITPSFAEDAMKALRTISISGHGEVSAVPDMASISVGVMTQADTAADALAANTTAMNALFSALKAAGLADKDIATSNFSVNPRYDYGSSGNQPPKVMGYDVSNSVTIIVRKISDLGGILDKAVAAGSNQINGISFTFADATKLFDASRKNAVEDARRKAELYAAASGVTLGDIITISEMGSTMPQPPIMMQAAMEKSAGGPVPVMQGEQTLSSDVSIVWAIK
jgi:uncharacterized protein